MPVFTDPAVELLSLEYSGSKTVTETDEGGEALSPVFGGSFTIADRQSVEIEVAIPQATNTGAYWVGVILFVDGVNKGVRMLWPLVGSLTDGQLGGKWRVHGLAPGAHTVELRGRVQDGTGTLIMGAGYGDGLLTIREL